VRERVKLLTRHWVEHGFGSPKLLPLVYLAKIALLYVALGYFIIKRTSGLTGHITHDFREPIFYQKAVVWTMLLEALNLGGSWGPLAGKFKPMMGGILFWARPGTIRLRPWAWVPGTAGDRRTLLDVALYLAFLGALLSALVLPGAVTPSLHAALPENVTGLIAPQPTLCAVVLIVLLGLRDKTIALAARIEQYLPALVLFVALPFRDMVIALKLAIVVVWVGAGVSKFGLHFPNVLPPMISNAPYWPPRWLKLAMYRSFPEDLRPSRLTTLLAHGPASFGEIVPPLVLLFSASDRVTLVLACFMALYHLFIFSTFPMAVPLEWNVIYGGAALILFVGFPASHGYTLADFSSPGLLALLACALLFLPVLGNFRPDLVSFLPSMRQYAGNWASALWAIKPEAEHKLDRVTRPTRGQVQQLIAMGYEPAVAELVFNMGFAFRTMHSQGRGLLSVLMHALPDLDQRAVREAESMCNALIGFNFGDGHLHDERMIAAVQREARFAPGELVVAWVESQPVHQGFQRYKLIDAALGVIERGTFRVADAVAEQPWLPRGPIPREVTWTRGATSEPSQLAGSAQFVAVRGVVSELAADAVKRA
jgi:Transmembrane protein of unknown function (DUF3556)